jgi:hypothetical protein
MARLRGLLAATLASALSLGCLESTRDSELLAVTGASSLSGWRCEPSGPRELNAGFRRSQSCITEQRHTHPELLTATTLTQVANGRVIRVGRTWGTSDSAVWRRLYDSVSSALTGQTRGARHCPTGMDSPKDSMRLGLADAPNDLTASIWRLPGYALVLSTSTPKAGARVAHWSMNVEAYSYGLVVCGDTTGPAA